MIREWSLDKLSIAIAAVVVLTYAAADAGQIRVWPSAVVTAEQVTLSDLAELRDFDLVTTERLRGLIVQEAPQPGGELLVRVEDIHDALRLGGENLASLSLMGATRCRVSKPRAAQQPRAVVEPFAKTPFPKSKRSGNGPQLIAKAAPRAVTLENALKEYLTARVGDHDGRVDIQFVSSLREELALNSLEYKFVIRKPDSPQQERSLGPVSVAVELQRDRAVARTVHVAAEVRLGIPVVVARKPINRGQTITAHHLKLEERLFDDWSKVGLTELYAAIGQQAKQFMRPGEMLATNAVQPRPIVRRGDVVTMWFRRGGLVVKTTGRAQQEGYLGSQISVRRDGTRKAKDLIDAIVTGPGTVELVDSVALAGQE